MLLDHIYFALWRFMLRILVAFRRTPIEDDSTGINDIKEK